MREGKIEGTQRMASAISTIKNYFIEITKNKQSFTFSAAPRG